MTNSSFFWQVYDSAKSVLEYYGKQRTQNAKGVTIPSQKRYINYYDVSLRNKLTYSSVKMYLRTGKKTLMLGKLLE